jgi:uncharacterized UBP type Zn finger protein
MFIIAFPNILLRMPPQCVNSKQRTISWGNTSTPMRQTPSRSNRTLIQNYSQLERREVSIQNPPKTPKTPAARAQVQDDGDIEMANGEEDQGGVSDSTISSDEEAQPTETPTRCRIPSTITVKRRHKGKKPQKPRDETTWTQHYFEVTSMDETWVNESKKSKPELLNRLWVYKICGPAFSSTDKERYGNTSKLNNHMQDAYDMDKRKHFLSVQ